MIQYAQPELLAQLCSAQKENLGILLVEVVANVLDVEVSKIADKRIFEIFLNSYTVFLVFKLQFYAELYC